MLAKDFPAFSCRQVRISGYNERIAHAPRVTQSPKVVLLEYVQDGRTSYNFTCDIDQILFWYKQYAMYGKFSVYRLLQTEIVRFGDAIGEFLRNVTLVVI